MVAADVVDLNAFAEQLHEVANDRSMVLRPEMFAKLPDVDDVSIQDYAFGGNCPEVFQKLIWTATVGAEVNV